MKSYSTGSTWTNTAWLDGKTLTVRQVVYVNNISDINDGDLVIYDVTGADGGKRLMSIRRCSADKLFEPEGFVQFAAYRQRSAPHGVYLCGGDLGERSVVLYQPGDGVAGIVALVVARSARDEFEKI